MLEVSFSIINIFYHFVILTIIINESQIERMSYYEKYFQGGGRPGSAAGRRRPPSAAGRPQVTGLKFILYR